MSEPAWKVAVPWSWIDTIALPPDEAVIAGARTDRVWGAEAAGCAEPD
jgi:hypothetical protein